MKTEGLIHGLVFSLILLFGIGVIGQGDVGADWRIECVDCPKEFTDFHPRAIATDSFNRPHIAYGGNHLYYAYYDGVEWKYETVDSSSRVGSYASIAIDSNNKVHISYYDDTSGDLKYATNSSGSWVTTTIDSAGDVGQFTSIAIDSNNKVHISYYDSANDYELKYATNASGSWITTTIDSGATVDSGDGFVVGTFTSIAIDSNNKVHISYSYHYKEPMVASYSYLKYATNASGSWVTTTVDSYGDSSGASYGTYYSSIALDSNNKVHISYFDAGNLDLKYATNVSGSWVTSTIDSTANAGSTWSTSIALDSNNKVHISYFDAGNLDLKYATNVSGSWVTSTIDSTGDVGLFTSIAIDSNDKVHISYYDYTNGYLKYATNTSGSWVITTIDNGGEKRYVGLFTSIAIDSLNDVHISYYAEWFKYNLKYATNASGSWVTTTIDSAGSVGSYTSIAIDSNNKIHISYYDFTSYDLKYTTNTSGSWVTTTVDSTGNVGASTSIALDSNNKVHISYFNAGNLDLKYATNTSGSWVTTTVDSTGNVGASTSIALDSNNKVHISYFDSGNVDLKYATNASGSWVTSTIDSTGYVGAYTSIAIDSNDKVHISYYDDTSDDLKYATNSSGSWGTTTIDSAGDVGQSTSIAIDSNNKVHIGYSDFTNKDLKYATNESGSWVTTTIDNAGSVGSYTSITIDLNNKIHISYYDATNYYLKYATNAPIDYDNDGYAVPVDCNDNDPSVNPGATEVCDGLDNDCNGSVDEGCNVDLYISSMSASSSANAGQTISVSDTTNKSGVSLVGATTTKIYLSTDNKYSSRDIELGSRAVPAFGSGAQSSSGSTSVTIPTNACTQTYYLIARADADKVIPEWNEGNNNRAIAIEITNPTPPVDFYVSSVSAPVSANAGQTISVSDTTNKSGPCAIGASTTKIYLSTDNKYSTSDIYLGDRAVGAFGAGAGNNPGSTDVTIPSGTPVGSYYIIVRTDADKVITEWNEGNNNRAGAITITSP